MINQKKLPDGDSLYSAIAASNSTGDMLPVTILTTSVINIDEALENRSDLEIFALSDYALADEGYGVGTFNGNGDLTKYAIIESESYDKYQESDTQTTIEISGWQLFMF